MNTTEILMQVKRPDGTPATIDQLRHARMKGRLSAPVGGWTEKHVEQLQAYVNEPRKRKAAPCA